jgi:sec-independent protein translocase protein TatA
LLADSGDVRKPPIMSVGPWQIIIIVLIVLLLFGAGRLSEIGKGLGEGIKNFKKGISGDEEDEGEDEEEERARKKKKKLKKAERAKELPPKRSSVREDETEPSRDEES